MQLVQLLLPLYDGQGRRIPRARFEELAAELTRRHGGLTAYVRTPATGLWLRMSKPSRRPGARPFTST